MVLQSQAGHGDLPGGGREEQSAGEEELRMALSLAFTSRVTSCANTGALYENIFTG